MAKIRALAKIAAKYSRVTPSKGKEYEEGIKDPKKVWADEAKAAAGAWGDGVSAAVARGAFAKGVEECGQPGYIDPALKKGVARYRGGVEYGVAKYNKKFAKFRDVIEATALPPRGPKGDPRNIDRVTAIASALHEAKIGKS